MANQEIDSLSLEISIKGLEEKDVKNLESLANSIAKLQRNLKKLEINKLQEIDIPQNIKGVTGVEMPLIKQIDEITEEIEVCAGGAGSSLGTGGMATKIAAAHKATKAGVNMVLANGEEPSIISNILKGEEVGTLFTAKK